MVKKESFMSTSLQVMVGGCFMRYPYSSQLRLAEESPMVTVKLGDDTRISAVRVNNAYR